MANGVLQTVVCPNCLEDNRVHMPATLKSEDSPTVAINCKECGEPLAEKIRDMQGDGDDGCD